MLSLERCSLLDKTDFGNCENCSNPIVGSVRIWIAGYCAKIVGCASSFTGLGGGLYSNILTKVYDFLQYDMLTISNYKSIKKERKAYNNKDPVGGAERKDSLAIGRPFVHIRWLVVVDQLGADKMILRKWKWLKNNGKVKVSGTSVFVRSCKRVWQADVEVAQLEDGSFEVIWIIRFWESHIFVSRLRDLFEKSFWWPWKPPFASVSCQCPSSKQ